jgi:two-component system, sensor histidine kinase
VRTRHVLVVEDNEDAREAVRCLLEVRGHRVEVAAEGHQAVAVALKSHPEVALIDISVPGLDGYEIAQRLRASAEGKGMYLVAMTGYSEPDHRRRAIETGFDAHLLKPVDPDELYRLLESG